MPGEAIRSFSWARLVALTIGAVIDFRCISQASASLLTDEVKGKSVDEVAAIRADDLLDLLGIDISPARLKCAMLSHDSLQHVLSDLGVATPTEASAGSGA